MMLGIFTEKQTKVRLLRTLNDVKCQYFAEY